MTIPPDKSPDAINPAKITEPIGTPVTPQQPSSFEAYMQGTTAGQKGVPPGTLPGTPEAPPGGPTPMEALTPRPIPTSGMDLNALQVQAKNMQEKFGDVGNQLNNRNLKLKRSQTHLVRQKLEDANGYIRAAGSMMGAPVTEQNVPQGSTGIVRFVAMLNDGQNQLVQVQQKLSEMSAKGQQLSPAQMLSVQVKMGLAQQEIEYTSTLLGKVIQSVTTVINTQL